MRLVIASGLHPITGIVLALLYGFKGVIFFLGRRIGLATYFYLGKHFIAPNNYTIPILASICIIALLGEAFISFLNDVMSFHRLLGIWNKKAKIKDDKQDRLLMIGNAICCYISLLMCDFVCRVSSLVTLNDDKILNIKINQDWAQKPHKTQDLE